MRSSQWKFLAVLAVLLLLPHVCKKPWHGITLYGPARLVGGDEPAYMLIISSLIEDGDLDLSNNYTSALNGSSQAGENFAGSLLGHHTAWFEGGTEKTWFDFYDGDHWRAQNNHPVPLPRVPGVLPLPNQAEFCTHPPGMAFAIFPILLLFKPIFALFKLHDAFEPLAIICSGLETILAAFFFLRLVNKYVKTEWVANTVTAMAFLGTPAWHYGRSLFSEPLLLLCAVAAYSLVLTGEGIVLPGVFLGIGILCKPPFLLLGIPLGAYLLFSTKDIRGTIRFGIPLAIASILVLYINGSQFGDPFRSSIQWSPGKPLEGAVGLLFSPDHGLFAFTPVALLALVGWVWLWQMNRTDSLVLGGGSAVYFLLMAAWVMWWGGFCYGPRLIMPIIPLLLVPLGLVLEACRSWWSKTLFWSLGAISILINLFGAIPYWMYWGKNPAFELISFLFPSFNIPVRS